MNLTTPRKAFSLIELLIVITVIGILSTLLFRTLSDMITANARIQQEKIMTNELITLQTTLNNISEHYPIIDMQSYQWTNSGTWEIDNNKWFTNTLYLKKKDEDKISITTSWWSLIVIYSENKITNITDPDRSVLTGVYFKVLPTAYYSGIIHEQLSLDQVNAEWFWIFWNISIRKSVNSSETSSSYNLQHFIHLQK